MGFRKNVRRWLLPAVLAVAFATGGPAAVFTILEIFEAVETDSGTFRDPQVMIPPLMLA